jgi:hypothetical protein
MLAEGESMTDEMKLGYDDRTRFGVSILLPPVGVWSESIDDDGLPPAAIGMGVAGHTQRRGMGSGAVDKRRERRVNVVMGREGKREDKEQRRVMGLGVRWMDGW